MDENRRRELGDFLRSRRERLTPEAVGLPAGRRRRTAGLRREEVADLAAIGVDWYVRLEQGRAVNPSPATIRSLARALRLNDAERIHLQALAGGGERGAFVTETVPDAVRRLVEALNLPAYVIGRRWDVLAWNDPAQLLFGFDGAAKQNILLSMMTDPSTRRLFGDGWADEARRMIALFRVTHDLWADDPAFEDLLQRLTRESADFARWWSAHDVRGGVSGRKRLHLADGGVRTFEYATFQANDDPGLRLALYTPVQTLSGFDGPSRT